MVDPVLLSAQAAEIRQMNTEEVDVEVRSEAYQVTLQNEAKKVHENKLKRITKLTECIWSLWKKHYRNGTR